MPLILGAIFFIWLATAVVVGLVFGQLARLGKREEKIIELEEEWVENGPA